MNEEFVMKDMNGLISIFADAVAFKAKYIGVKIQMEGFEEPEIIINKRANFKTKLAYYQNAYNNDLTLKTRNTIRIVDCTYGNTFKELEDYLV